MAYDEGGAPRHGRHSSTGRRAVSRTGHEGADTQRPQDVAVPPETDVAPVSSAGASPEHEGAAPPLTPISDGDQETRMGDAPRPIDVDPSETGSFRRISSDEGARLTTRANASETGSFRLDNARPVESVRMGSVGRPKVRQHEVAVKSNRRVFVILGVAAAIVVILLGSLVTRALLSVEQAPEETVSEQMQSSGDEGIEYRGTTYRLTEQDDGTHALTSTSEGSEGTAVLYRLEGTPVTLILYNSVFVIPENRPDGTWDLIAYPLGGGSVAQQVTGSEGEPVTGTGEIDEARLVGDAVQVVTTTGERTNVSLV